MRFGNLAFAAAITYGAICASASKTYSANLEILGTGDAMVALRNVADAFNKAFPNHRASVPPSIGSSGGIKAVAGDQAVLGRIARKLKKTELAYELAYVPVMKFPVVFFTYNGVGVSDLSTDQVNAIYSGEITDWKSVGGPAGKIRVIRREEGDSSLSNLRATFPGFSAVKITPFSKITETTQRNLEAVETIERSIGFGPYSDAVNANVRVVSINGKAPTEAGYPSYGVLALIFKEQNETGVVSDFIEFVLSPDGAAAIKAADAVPYR